jgi:hypothetical protein
VPHISLLPFLLIWLLWRYMARSSNHEPLHCTVFWGFSLLRTNALLSTLFSNTLAYLFTFTWETKFQTTDHNSQNYYYFKHCNLKYSDVNPLNAELNPIC